MIIPVIIEIEVDEIAWCFGKVVKIYGAPHIEHIVGKIIHVAEDYITIENIYYRIPIHRVRAYTFGGIDVPNYRYNQSKVEEENNEMLRKLNL